MLYVLIISIHTEKELFVNAHTPPSLSFFLDYLSSNPPPFSSILSVGYLSCSQSVCPSIHDYGLRVKLLPFPFETFHCHLLANF